MPRIALLGLLTIVAAASASAGGAGNDKGKLQGHWELTGIRVGGLDIPPKDSKLILTFTGDKIISREGDKKEEMSTFTLDETRKPKQLTVAKTAKEKREGELTTVKNEKTALTKEQTEENASGVTVESKEKC